MSVKQAAYGQPAVYNATAPVWQDGEPAALQVDQNGNLLVAGAIGGGGGGVSAKYNVTPPTYTDGQTATLQTDANGNLRTIVNDAAGPTNGSLTVADAASAVSTGFNGSSFITGTPTAGSSLSIAFNGENAVAIQLTGTWVASVSFERSIDNGTTWHPASVISSGQNYSSVTGNGLFFINAAGATNARVRIPAGAFTSGTVAASLYAATGIFPLSLVSAVSGMYNATNPTLADKGVAALQLDVNGNQKSNLATKLDAVNDGVTAYPYGHSYTNITTNTTTNVKSGAGFLRSIKINNPSAITVASLTLTIYDNTAGSGTKIGTIVLAVDAAAKPFSINYDAAFTTGLTIVTAGPTVAADITVEWR